MHRDSYNCVKPMELRLGFGSKCHIIWHNGNFRLESPLVNCWFKFFMGFQGHEWTIMMFWSCLLNKCLFYHILLARESSVI